MNKAIGLSKNDSLVEDDFKEKCKKFYLRSAKLAAEKAVKRRAIKSTS